MTKAKTTRRALVSSVIALFLCFSMLLGTTFAWFTDSVTSSGNVIQSGTLDVTMEWYDGKEAVPAKDSDDWKDASEGAIFNSTLWEPGYAEVRHIKIANEGTLALKYKLHIIANGDVSALADVIDVYYVDPATQIADRTALTEDRKLGTLTDVLAGLDTSGYGELKAGEYDTVTLALKMQETAGNEYQDLSIGTDFTVQLLATQLTSESDSFGTDYDDITLVANASDLANAIAAGKNVMLTSDVALDVNGKAMTIAADANVIIDLNGNDIVGTTTVTGASQILFEVKGELTVVGDGTIALYDKSGAAFNDAYENAAIYVNGGVANLNEGMIVTVSDGAAMAYAADAVGGDSVINVNGATLYSSYIGIRSFPTASGKTNTVNYNSGVVYGGKNGYDIWTQEGSGSSVVNIANGISYTREDQWGGMYYVADDVAFVSNYAGLTEAIENATAGDTIALVNDVTVSDALTMNKSFTLDLNGKTLYMSTTDDSKISSAANVIIKNGNVDISGVNFTEHNGIFNITGGAANTLTVENVNFYGDGFTSYSVFWIAKASSGINTLNLIDSKFELKNEAYASGGFIKHPSGVENCSAINIT